MKPALYLAFGLVGGVLGALLVRALEPRPQERTSAPARAAPAMDEATVERIANAAVERRFATMPTPAAEPAAPERLAAAPARAEGEGPGEGVQEGPEQVADVAEVIKRLKGRKMGPDETGSLFAWLTLHKERTAEVIAAIQKEIASDPTNPELQVELATAYVADLTNNTMPGPQQGLVWAKASGAYDAAIKLDPEHWQARFGKAFGTSMIPEFLGQRPEAIRQFEDLLEIQKRKPTEPYFARTYFRLGTLYKDAGNLDKAREMWNAGIAQFPDNEELKAALETSTKR